MQIGITAPGETISTGDGQGYFLVTDDLNGLNLVDADASIVTTGSGATTVQIHNLTQAADMLATAITIDSGERTSYTAATPPVIDAGNDDVATGDLLRFDIDGVGAGADGLIVTMEFA